MGLFERLFGNRPKIREDGLREEFKVLNGYTPHFTSFSGGVYESELIRSAIHARANHISKLRVEISGSAKPSLRGKLKYGPSQFQTWGQFLYRLSTILDVHNTAFITPVYNEFGEVSGIYCPLPSMCDIVQYGGKPYLRYEFAPGQRAAIELEACGILTKHQYKHDFFGESNRALIPTMDLINIQNQGIEEGVKSAATYRFIATLTNFVKPEDLAKERQRFTEKNLSAGANADGGILLFPNTYKDVRQVDSKPFVVNAAQMAVIKDSVYEYFGVNEDILQNKAYGDAWGAFYEGAIEPFAIQFSEVMTRMLFTMREQAQGNQVVAIANRLQYMRNSDKLSVSTQLLDRGIMSINDVREIWNLPPVEDGDTRIIRGEYYNADDKLQEIPADDDDGNEV